MGRNASIGGPDLDGTRLTVEEANAARNELHSLVIYDPRWRYGKTLADRRCGNDVLTEDDVALRKTLEQPVINHRLGAFRRFLGGLKDGHDRAAP
jgi:hypothetical protein